MSEPPKKTLISLPPEILLMIFKKLGKRDLRRCRDVNLQFTGIIERSGLLRDDKSGIELRIATSTFNYGTMIGSVSIDVILDETKETYTNYAELLERLPRLLEDITGLQKLSLSYIEVSDKLLDILMDTDFVSRIRELEIIDCSFTPNINTKWFEYLEQMKLDSFFTSLSKPKHYTPIPKTILKIVKYSFTYLTTISNNGFDLSWLNDNAMIEWLSPEKDLDIGMCQTGMTLDYLATLFYSDMKPCPNKSLSFGILTDITPWRMQYLNDHLITLTEYSRTDQLVKYSLTNTTGGPKIQKFYCFIGYQAE